MEVRNKSQMEVQTLNNASPFVLPESDVCFGNFDLIEHLPQSNKDLHEVAEFTQMANRKALRDNKDCFSQ